MTKVILITGSTEGIGKLTALKLAKEGHRVYLHGRNLQKLERVISEIKQTSKNENISGFVADFSDLAAVSKMAKQIKLETPKLDILINNAGIFKSNISHNKDELDIRLVVNYLAPYLLTTSILPILKKSDGSRIINLSSAAQAPVSFTALDGSTSLNVNDAYAQSKLALTMWSFYLAKMQNAICIIAVNPGSLLNTKMALEAYGQHWSPADKGVNILYDLAISEEYKNDSGKYFDNDKGNPKGAFSLAHTDAYDENLITKLIDKTKSLVN